MLKITGLKKAFSLGAANEVQALAGVDLTVNPGEMVSIIGANGSGKSTLIGCLAGAYIPDAGSIVLDGKDITSWPEYKRAKLISRVFQDPLLGSCASMSVAENLALAHRRGKVRGLRRGIAPGEKELFRAALAPLGLSLEERLNDPVGLLSGGQRQALTLIMATLVKPSLLLLDEHTAAQDPRTASLTMRLTQDLVEKERLTTLMITHNMAQAVEYGQRLVMLKEGRILKVFSGQEKKDLTVKTLLESFLAAGDDPALSDQ
ncbi:MAG: ATP-binding cassette domain-containing protein [Deltaproteobacteria bacterium]|jgi:putative ABC transport system ATP-binding protein|nr:ATP-binding cassette domain-containing protein [Deltaproteobacteria bacterium]